MAVSPQRPKGPSLNALRAFEAAARLGGFANAAEELCVTPAAVAQQVKALEHWTGKPLFQRRSQGVELTDFGRDAQRTLTDAFDRLGEATLTLRRAAQPNVLRIAALPCIAQLWLSPRLPAIRAALPDLTVSVTAMESVPNLRREPYDLSLFYESPDIGNDAVVLSDDILYPVCAPALAAMLGSIDDLRHVRLLHDSTWHDDWERWLDAVVPTQRFPIPGASFSLYALAVDEAKHGAGVLMGHEALVASAIDEGTLVAPFGYRLRLPRAMVLRRSDSHSDRALAASVDALLNVLLPSA